VHVRESLSRYRKLLLRARRLFGDLATLACLAIVAPIAHKASRYQLACGLYPRVCHTVQCLKRTPLVMKGHDRAGGAPCHVAQ
jgi:hypothetical protein